MEDAKTTNDPAPKKSGWGSRLVYLLVVAVVAVGTGLVTALLMNIQERKQEAKNHFLKIADLDESTIDPAVWGQNFPRQYSAYKKTVDVERTKHGGSEAIDKLEQYPPLKLMFAGYAFSIDFREERGHAYMLKDQEETKRVTERKQPGACLHCHASIIPAYRKAGDGDVMAGFEKVCAMPWEQAHKMVDHPVTCLDCHDPQSINLRVTRPAFMVGINELAGSSYALPQFASIETWRSRHFKKDGDGNYVVEDERLVRKNDSDTAKYDPNKLASHQEMRSFVCAQCHVEYYFKGKGTLLTYPWSKGLKAEQMEEYYEDISFQDWKHKITGASMLKAQHPEFEMWTQGIHSRSGVSCADCHMPYIREGAVKISDHHVRSPLLNISRACQVCHRYDETELLDRAESIQDRTKNTLVRAQNAVADLIKTIEQAKNDGIDDEQLKEALALHRKAQWRADFVSSENSLGFHASQEAMRILAEAIDYARQGQLSVPKKQ